jgi:hypothetical protein
VGEPPASYGEIIKVNLGAPRPAEDKVVEWELGRNQCAVAARQEKAPAQSVSQARAAVRS